MRIQVALWDNSNYYGVRFGVDVAVNENKDWERIARISLSDQEPVIPPAREQDWRQAKEDVESGKYIRLMGGMGYTPGNADKALPDIFGILQIPENMVLDFKLWRDIEFYAIQFDLAKPSAWISEAQAAAGMVGLWMAGADNSPNETYDMGYMPVVSYQDREVERETDRLHEKQWCRENGIEW